MEPTDPRYRLIIGDESLDSANPEMDPELAALANALADDRAALLDLGLPEPPSGFAERVLARAPRPIRTWTWRALAAAAVVAFVLGGAVGSLVDTATPVDIAPLTILQDCEAPVPAAEPKVATARSTGTTRHTSVRFVYVGEPGQTVQVVGGFNAWGEQRIALSPTAVAGVYQTTIDLPKGEHEYMFVIDGDRFIADPLADRTRSDGFGRRNSVLMI